jgi:hypothetical protein
MKYLVGFGSQHNDKNKQIELHKTVLFDSCSMFRSSYGTIFRQSHQNIIELS